MLHLGSDNHVIIIQHTLYYMSQMVDFKGWGGEV